jgi:RimJ/RimL family protein N-acetyltransferase
MEIRPARPADLDDVAEIDGTIESTSYLHLDRAGEGLAVSWKLAERPLREARIQPNRMDDERWFLLKQVATNIVDDGVALVAEHDGAAVALLLAQLEPLRKAIRIHDLRVDFDHRRQGLATAMLFQIIATAREQELRAVAAETQTDNLPAAQLLQKCGFELAGVDTRRMTNHDLVKESATLFWYAALD